MKNNLSYHSTKSPAQLMLFVFACAAFIIIHLGFGLATVKAQLDVKIKELQVNATVEPFENDAVVYSTLAPKQPGELPQALVALAITLDNQESKTMKMNKVSISFAGQPASEAKTFPVNFSVGAKKKATFNFTRDENIVLKIPAPKQIKVEIFFENVAAPVTVIKPLAAHANSTRMGSYKFPAAVFDLAAGEYWSGSSGHPGGDQRFGYDMGIVAWDAQLKQWSNKYPDKDGTKNEDYRIWNKSIHAMAAGTVISCTNNKKDNPVPGQKLEGGGGNHFVIQHGNERVLYAHMREGSINASLCKVGTAIKSGDLLGRAGNSGSSDAPHLHIHATSISNNQLRPLLFNNIQILGRNQNSAELNDVWVIMENYALPLGKNVIIPAIGKPAQK